jgi:4-amino-4-deoxy-L-arabinose transferase-like glycosyltransferase
LWWIILVPMIALHVSIGRRWYYLLPAIAPLSVLMAKFGIDAAQAMIHSGKAALLRNLAVLHVIGLAVAIFIFRAVESEQTDPPIVAAILMLSAAGLVIVWIFQNHHQPQRVITAVLLVGAIFLATAQIRSSLWDDKRFAQRSFAMAVEHAVPAEAELIAWEGDWAREVYYNRRQILEVDEPDELKSHLKHPGDTFLLVDQPFNAEFPEFNEVLVAEASIEGRTRQLWRIADGS